MDSLTPAERRVLADSVRESILSCLAQCDPPLDVDTLTQRVLETRHGVDKGEYIVPREEFDTTQSNLHHTHLPLMDDAGVLTYDAGDNCVVAVDDATVTHLLQAT